MQTAVAALGGIVLLVALIGFVRSLWRSPSGDGSRGYGPTIQGEGQGGDGGHHGGFDGGGHGS